MKQIMETQMKRRTLVSLVLGGALIIGGGNGGCETMNLDDLNAVTYHSLANTERSKGNYKKANGYEAFSQLSGIAGNRAYASNQAEKNRQAQTEAAQIRANAERDAARIRAEAERDADNARTARTQTERDSANSYRNERQERESPANPKRVVIKEVKGMAHLKNGGFIMNYKDGDGNIRDMRIPERYNKMNDNDSSPGKMGPWKIYNNRENGLYIIEEK